MSPDIVADEFRVDALMERIDELFVRGKPNSRVVYKLIARDGGGRKVSLLSIEPFSGVQIGDRIRVSISTIRE